MAIYPQRDDQRKQREREVWCGATDTEDRVLMLHEFQVASEIAETRNHV